MSNSHSNKSIINGNYIKRWYAKDDRDIEFMDQFMMD